MHTIEKIIVASRQLLNLNTNPARLHAIYIQYVQETNVIPADLLEDYAQGMNYTLIGPDSLRGFTKFFL